MPNKNPDTLLPDLCTPSDSPQQESGSALSSLFSTLNESCNPIGYGKVKFQPALTASYVILEVLANKNIPKGMRIACAQDHQGNYHGYYFSNREKQRLSIQPAEMGLFYVQVNDRVLCGLTSHLEVKVNRKEDNTSRPFNYYTISVGGVDLCIVHQETNKLLMTPLVSMAEEFLTAQAVIITEKLKSRHPDIFLPVAELRGWLFTYLISNEQKLLNFETYVMHRFGSRDVYPDTSVMFNPSPFMEA